MQEINQDKSKPVRAAESKKKILIFVVCYNAEKSIESVLDRIPKDIWEIPIKSLTQLGKVRL